MKIAISKASGDPRYANYEAWLKSVDDSVEVMDLNGFDPEGATAALAQCSGLILSGGADVHPRRYGHEERLPQCGPIEEERDERELALVRAAAELRVPTLGVCRGAQVLNVAYGGTLIADIPTTVPDTVGHGSTDGVDAVHSVEVEPGSMIKKLCGVMEGTINSAHHQAVEHLAHVFTPSAIAPDGVIEAFEFGDASMGGKSFLLAVQWHPERMDWSSPLSGRIAEAFLNECAAYHMLLRGK